MNIAIVLSGGTGTRMGLDIPKQYVEVGGKPIIQYCLQTILEHKDIGLCVVVVAKEWLGFVKNCVDQMNITKPVLFAEPGELRQQSIINGLHVAKRNGAMPDDIVLIHDAARPLLSSELITACLDACKNSDAVLPVIPVKDTTYYSRDGKKIDSLLERKTLWNGQAPEAFAFGSYFDANMRLTEGELKTITGSTEVAYRAGLKCVLIPGDSNNFKITTMEDLSNFKAIIENESI